MRTDGRRTQIREVRSRLVREGPPWTRGHERDFETVAIPERDCDLLRDLLISEGAQTVVEVGLAYASSALAIGEALVTVDSPHPRHIVIDPFQQLAWSNVGWDLLCSAGLDSIADLMVAPSSIALPQLVSEGVIADAAFVDGSHRFHENLGSWRGCDRLSRRPDELAHLAVEHGQRPGATPDAVNLVTATDGADGADLDLRRAAGTRL